MQYSWHNHRLNLRGKSLYITHPWVMGILNATPDSFYAESRANEEHDTKRRVTQILADGAQIIDIGAYSTRPGAQQVSLDDEWQRLEKALKVARDVAPDAIISVDTFRSEIARRSVSEYAVDIINDVSGGNLDKKMPETVAKLGVPYVLMHMQGDPTTMQSLCNYTSVVSDVREYLLSKAKHLKQMGINDVIIDPGFGFSKTIEQNYELLNRLESITESDFPVLVGLSRKSMAYKPLGITPQDALNATTALHTIALLKGAAILRVHDVKAAVEAIKIVALTQQVNN
ncbi:MAG: dihydropteroate synthase [Bacteroidaceae bacterium]|nr:dihydropteroate synthase [Bacteroidaceae bacterium]